MPESPLGQTQLAEPGRRKRVTPGGHSRAKSLSVERRKEIAKSAAAKRWGKEEAMSSQVQRMSAAMFPLEGTKVVNVKFFLGTSRTVTAEELADQLDRADAQLRSGAALRTTKLDGELTIKQF